MPVSHSPSAKNEGWMSPGGILKVGIGVALLAWGIDTFSGSEVLSGITGETHSQIGNILGTEEGILVA